MASSTAPQQFNLRWNNHTNNILQVFAEQLSKENLVDVTISCEGQFIKAHKMVLSACSPYFQELFQFHQVPHPVIIINGMTFLDIRLVIEFMYRGEVKVQEADLGGLLLAAETLQVKGLANVRNKYEKKQMQENNEDSMSGKQSKQDSKKSHSRKSGQLIDDSSMSDMSTELRTHGMSSTSKEREFDDDLPATIKIEPPDIRDIDEDVPAGWDSPGRLVIDMPKTETMAECKQQLESVQRKRPSILRTPIPSIRVSSAHLEMTDQDVVNATRKDIPEVSTPARCFMWQKRHPRLLGSWGRSRICKIPRPPNAFMIFANDNRRKLAVQNPDESNKEISVRLGSMWKNLDSDSKETYYSAARKADEDHKVKYPGYYYSPKEARIRKGLKQRRIVSGLPAHMDALRFVKVYMSSAEKNNLIAKEQQTSLLRKLQAPPEQQNMETTETQSPLENTETVQNVDGPSNQPDLIGSLETPIEVDNA